MAAVKVGTRAIDCTVSDSAGQVAARIRMAHLPDDGSDRVGAVAEAVRETANLARLDRDLRLAHVGSTDDHRPPRLAAVGVAVPGIIDAQGMIKQSPSVPDWVGVDAGRELSKRLGCRVSIENDSKLAAYAEHRIWGGADDLIFIRLGRRISIAAIIEGRILQGSHRLAGDLGSQRGMRWTRTSDSGELRWSTGKDAEELFGRAKAGDQQAIREIDAFCAEIAPRIAALALAIDPERVVIGGGLSEAGDTLLLPLQRHVTDQLMTVEKPIFHPAVLGLDGAIIGAAGHAFERSSLDVFGIPAVPAPWDRFSATAHPE